MPPPFANPVLLGATAVVAWRNQYDGSSGRGRTIKRSDLAGLVYYATPGNIELVTKVLDLGQEVKLFYAPLSDLDYSLRITNMSTGELHSFANSAPRVHGDSRARGRVAVTAPAGAACGPPLPPFVAATAMAA